MVIRRGRPRVARHRLIAAGLLLVMAFIVFWGLSAWQLRWQPASAEVQHTQRSILQPRGESVDLDAATSSLRRHIEPGGPSNIYVEPSLLHLFEEMTRRVQHSEDTHFRLSRQRYADRLHVAPLRACFVALTRHSDEGLHKLHRLLVNVRQMMPVTAGKYPFVAFHESMASEQVMLRTMLKLEREFQKSPTPGHGLSDQQLFTNTAWQDLRNVFAELSKRQGWNASYKTETGNSDAAAGMAHLEDLFAADQKVSSSLDTPSLRVLMRRFVFPRLISHPDQLLLTHESLRRRHNTVVGDISGFHFVALDESEFGKVPSSVVPEGHRPWPYPGNSYWGVSYRHMCRFFGVKIFTNPFLVQNRFDYYLRLDTDSFILSMPRYEAMWGAAWREKQMDQFFDSDGSRRRDDQQRLVLADYFETMKSQGAKYAFSMLHPQTIHQFRVGVWEMFDSFVADEKRRRQGSSNPNQCLVGESATVSSSFGSDDLRRQAVIALSKSMEASDEAFRKNCVEGRGSDDAKAGFTPSSVFPFPRQDLVHFWDNFEIVDLQLFAKDYSTSPHGGEEVCRINPVSEKDLADAALSRLIPQHGLRRNNPPMELPTSIYALLINKGEQSDVGIHELPILWDVQGEEGEVEDEGSVRATYEGSTIYGALGDLSAEVVQQLQRSRRQEMRRLVIEAANITLAEVGPQRRRELLHALVGMFRWKQCRQRLLKRQRVKLVTDFLATVESSGGFYYHRWGDAEVHTLLMSLALSPREIVYVESLPYQHYFNYHCPRSPPVVGGEKPTVEDMFAHHPPSDYDQQCEKAALASYPQGKERGSARMSPAEMSHFNDLLSKWTQGNEGFRPI